jgi:hypothetical protein
MLGRNQALFQYINAKRKEDTQKKRRRPERRRRRKPARKRRRAKAPKMSRLGGSSYPRVIQCLSLLRPAS